MMYDSAVLPEMAVVHRTHNKCQYKIKYLSKLYSNYVFIYSAGMIHYLQNGPGCKAFYLECKYSLTVTFITMHIYHFQHQPLKDDMIVTYFKRAFTRAGNSVIYYSQVGLAGQRGQT